MAKAKSVASIKAAAKKTMKKVATKKPTKVVAQDTPLEPKEKPKGFLLVNFYEKGFDITIENCTTGGIMRAVEEIASRHLIPSIVKK